MSEECFITGCGGEEGNGKVRPCDDDDDEEDDGDDDDDDDDDVDDVDGDDNDDVVYQTC